MNQNSPGGTGNRKFKLILWPDANRLMKRVAFWNVLIGVASVPVGIMIAESLAQAVSSVAGADWQVCLFHASMFALLTAVRLALTFFTKTHVVRLQNKAEQSYRQSLYEHFLSGTSSLHQSEPASFTTVFRRDAKQVSAYYAETLPTFLVACVGFATYMLYVCVALNGPFFALCMLVLGLLSLLQPIILEKFLIRNFIEADQAEAVLAQHLASGLEGFATIKMLKLHDWYMNRYRPKQKAFWRVGVRASASGTLSNTMEDMNRFLQTLGLVSLLGWAMLRQWTTFSVAMQIFLLSPSVYSYIATLFHIKQDSATCRAARSRIDKFLPNEGLTSEPIPVLQGRPAEVIVSGLWYETADKLLVEDVQFTLSPGEKSVVRGENGAGKSTLLALLMGQIAPAKGQITVGGIPVTLGVGRLRDWIAYCPQTAPTMRCTARELYDRAIAARVVSGSLLRDCAAELDLREEDLQKPISDLSGGTQKKTILCLTLAKQAPLLLLDEPEAMLDRRAAEALVRILGRQNRTMLIVTHSPLFDALVDSHLTFINRQIQKSTETKGGRGHESHSESGGH